MKRMDSRSKFLSGDGALPLASETQPTHTMLQPTPMSSLSRSSSSSSNNNPFPLFRYSATRTVHSATHEDFASSSEIDDQQTKHAETLLSLLDAASRPTSNGSGLVLHASVSATQRPPRGGSSVFTIDIKVGTEKWSVCRTFADFKRLNRSLRRSNMPSPQLPSREMFRVRSRAFLRRRQGALDLWLQGVCCVWQSMYDASLVNGHRCREGVDPVNAAMIEFLVGVKNGRSSSMSSVGQISRTNSYDKSNSNDQVRGEEMDCSSSSVTFASSVPSSPSSSQPPLATNTMPVLSRSVSPILGPIRRSLSISRLSMLSSGSLRSMLHLSSSSSVSTISSTSVIQPQQQRQQQQRRQQQESIVSDRVTESHQPIVLLGSCQDNQQRATVPAALKRSISSPVVAAETSAASLSIKQQQARVDWSDAGSMATSVGSSMWHLSGSECGSVSDQSDDDDDEDDDIMPSCPATPTQTQLVPLRHRKSFSLSFASVDDVQFTMDHDDRTTPSFTLPLPVIEGADGDEEESEESENKQQVVEEEEEEEEGAQSFVHVDSAEGRIEFTFSPVSSCGSNHPACSAVPGMLTVDELDLDVLDLDFNEDDEEDDDDEDCYDSDDAEFEEEEEEEEDSDVDAPSSNGSFTPFVVRHACEYREFDTSTRVSHSLRRRNPNHCWRPFHAVVPLDMPLDLSGTPNTSTSKVVVAIASSQLPPPPSSQQQMCFTPVSIPPTPGGRGVFDESWHGYTTALLGYVAEQLTAEIQTQTLRAPSPVHINNNNNNSNNNNNIEFAPAPERHLSPLPSGGEALVHVFNAIQESPRSSLESASTPSTLVLPGRNQDLVTDAYVDMESISYDIINGTATPRAGSSMLSRDLFGVSQPEEEGNSSSSDGNPARDDQGWLRRINNKKNKNKNMSFGQMPSEPMGLPCESTSSTP